MRQVTFYLTTVLLLMVTMTTAAEDGVRYGCRRGHFSPNAVQRRAPEQSVGRSYLGPCRQLTILASFADQQFKGDEAATLAQWEKIFNQKDFQEAPFIGSLHDYFYAQSYGQFDLTFDLLYIQLSGKRERYKSTYEDDENSQYLVDDIVDVLLTKDIDYSPYDWDGDGQIDQLLIIFAGKGSSYGGFGGGYDAIWPHQWWLSQHYNLETDNKYDYRSYRTVSSGDKDYIVDCYCALQELASDGTYGSFGTICHEFSHCLGLPDFYYGNKKFVDMYDVMDCGNYNGDGFHPCNYSAHERMLMGWLTPTELTEQTSITNMPALADQGEAYMVRNNAVANEYYIIENRQQSGWDQDLPGSGLLVFHINYDKDIWEGSTDYANTSEKQRYYLFHANNSSTVKGWPYPYITKDEEGTETVVNCELTNTSTPAAVLLNANADGEMLMSKPITKMSVDANGLASFTFMDSEVTGLGDATRLKNHEEIINNNFYDLQGRRLTSAPARGVYIVRSANGATRLSTGSRAGCR